jgi:hypothetical protein
MKIDNPYKKVPMAGIVESAKMESHIRFSA